MPKHLDDKTIDAEARWRVPLIEVLGEIGDTRAVDSLISALKYPLFDDVREAAADALVKFRYSAVKPVSAVLLNEEIKTMYTRETAAWVLKSIVGQDFRLVAELLSNQLQVREQALAKILAKAQSGDLDSLRIIADAIRAMIGRFDVTFHSPGLIDVSGEEVTAAVDKLLTLAREKRLLENPAQTQSLIPLIGMSGQADRVMSEVGHVGGPEGLHAYQLLGVHLQVHGLLIQKGLI